MALKFPTYFISHGGGPWPWLADWRIKFKNLENALAAMPQDFGAKPKAILVISGHWEDDTYAVMASARPPMLYDYSGFPPETYKIQYPAPGAPSLAMRTFALLQKTGLPTRLDETQGYDHGTFSPLYIMYPQADMPIYQLSLRRGYDVAEHIAVGRALAPLREEGVVIMGSGLSFHNLRLFGRSGQEPSRIFDGWLRQTMQEAPQHRVQSLLQWEQAPAARLAHPGEDHLMPLMVALGAAIDETATEIYHEDAFFGSLSATSFRFGKPASFA